MQFTVRDLMSSEPAVIPSEASIGAALTHLLDCEASELYVIDAARRLLGVVPDFALLKARLLDNSCGDRVVQIMTAGIATVSPTARALEIAPLFREGYCRQLPVVDHGILVGQLARRDVLWMLRMVDEMRNPGAPATAASSEAFAAVPPPRFLQSARSLSSTIGRHVRAEGQESRVH